MNQLKQMALEAIEFLQKESRSIPEIGILTGTGLGRCLESVNTSAEIPYREIPNFPVSTVESHSGKLFFGIAQSTNIIAMQGRVHLYEGYSPEEVTFPIRVMQELGVKNLIVTNASGGLNPDFNPGDIMIISDHINLTGSNPLTGPNEESWGIRFPDMTGAYDKGLTGKAETVGASGGIALKKGVYAGLLGPSLETPAEVRFIRKIGADAVGFSTVHEVITAIHAGIKVLGLSVITNVHDPNNPSPTTLEEVIAVTEKVAPNLEKIITGVFKQFS